MKKAFLKKDFLYNIFGAPVRIRTRTNGSEDHCAIHYTTRAYFVSFYSITTPPQSQINHYFANPVYCIILQQKGLFA